MARQIKVDGPKLRVLDPAAGTGVLCCAAVEALLSHPSKPQTIELVVYEVDGQVLDECQIIVAGRARGLGEREITRRYMLYMCKSLLPKADREPIAEVLENMADRGILIRLEGDGPTYVRAWSNAEWAKRWGVGSVEFDRKWESWWGGTGFALVRDGYDNEEARKLRKLLESARRNLEIVISELPRDSNSPSP